MAPDERLARADQKIQAMLDLAIELVHLHECNKLVAYDDQLKGQIPLSHAGVAYRIFSKALVQRELLGVCTLWDSCGEDRHSIPTVVNLLDDDGVREAILNRKVRVAKEGRQLSAQNDDPELLAWITQVSDRDIAGSANRRVELLDNAVREAHALEASSIVRAARDFRDWRLAHNLSPDAKKFPDLSAKMGDEGRLLEATLPVLNDLNLAGRNSSYDWAGTWKIAQRNAEALWLGCKFEVLE